MPDPHYEDGLHKQVDKSCQYDQKRAFTEGNLEIRCETRDVETDGLTN